MQVIENPETLSPACADSRNEPVPAFKLIEVTAAWFTHTRNIPAYSTGSKHRGTWATPHFTEEQAHRLCSVMPTLSYDAVEDAFVAKHEWAFPRKFEEVFAAMMIDVDGAPVKVYPIGTLDWGWIQSR